jgi:hypothetical protein
MEVKLMWVLIVVVVSILGACRTSRKNDPCDTEKDFITRVMELFLAQIRRFLPIHPPI